MTPQILIAVAVTLAWLGVNVWWHYCRERRK